MRDVRDATKRSWFDYSTWLQHAEIASAILLAIATVVTAWSAYQSTRWSGVQSIHFSQASAVRIESTRSFNLAIQRYGVDAMVFAQWVNAYAEGNSDLEAFYRERVMDTEFLPVLDEWIASNPLTNPDAARNPLLDQGYRDQLIAPSIELTRQAEGHFRQAEEANQTSDNYVLATVVCASVLFFAGIANKFTSRNIRAVLLSLATLSLTGAIIFVLSQPVW